MNQSPNKTTSITKENRIGYIDIAKFLAMSCVILGHKLSSTYALFWPFHLPIFFIISGFFLSTNGPMTDFIIKKAKVLLIPYYLTCLVICVLSIPFALIRQDSVWSELTKWVKASIWGMGHTITYSNGITISQIGAIWFLWAMFLSLIIVRLIVKSNNILQILLVTALPIIAIYSSKVLWLPLSIQSAMFAVPFIYIGYLLKCNKKDLCAAYNSNKPIILVFCLMIGIWGFLRFNQFSINKCIMGNGIIDIVVACADSLLVLFVSELIYKHTKAIASSLEWLGKSTLIMLCVHIVELNLIPWKNIARVFISSEEYSQLFIAVTSYLLIILITLIIKKCLRHFNSPAPHS